MRNARTILCLIAGALALAGCGGSTRVDHVSSLSGATGPSGGSATTATAPPPTTATVTTPLTIASTTTTTPAGGAPACTAANLTPTFLGSNGAAGHVVLGFALRNSGSTACHTYGFPGVALLSAAAGGAAVGPNPKRTTQDYAGSAPERAITLQPGDRASFRIVTSDVTSGGQSSCPSAAAAQIIAPDDTATMHVSFTAIVDCGTPTVSPLEPGTTAFPGP